MKQIDSVNFEPNSSSNSSETTSNNTSDTTNNTSTTNSTSTDEDFQNILKSIPSPIYEDLTRVAEPGDLPEDYSREDYLADRNAEFQEKLEKKRREKEKFNEQNQADPNNQTEFDDFVPSIHTALTATYPKKVTSSFIKKAVDNSKQLIRDNLSLVLHTKEDSTICERHHCEKLHKSIANNLKKDLKKGKKSKDNEEGNKPRCCNTLSHVTSEMVTSILRVFPINPLELQAQFDKWFSEETLRNLREMNQINKPFCPTQIFYVPEASKVGIWLINPVIAVDGNFLKKKRMETILCMLQLE